MRPDRPHRRGAGSGGAARLRELPSRTTSGSGLRTPAGLDDMTQVSTFPRLEARSSSRPPASGGEQQMVAICRADGSHRPPWIRSADLPRVIEDIRLPSAADLAPSCCSSSRTRSRPGFAGLRTSRAADALEGRRRPCATTMVRSRTGVSREGAPPATHSTSTTAGGVVARSHRRRRGDGPEWRRERDAQFAGLPPDDAGFTIRADAAALIGPNGAGKSRLVNCRTASIARPAGLSHRRHRRDACGPQRGPAGISFDVPESPSA
jgi:hypothetical protein